jgi:hypothetical protein
MLLMPSSRALAGGACWFAASALLAVVALRLMGWSRGPVTAFLLVGLPVVLLPSYVLALLAVVRRDRPSAGRPPSSSPRTSWPSCRV